MQFHTFLNLDQQKPQLYFGLFAELEKHMTIPACTPDGK